MENKRRQHSPRKTGVSESEEYTTKGRRKVRNRKEQEVNTHQEVQTRKQRAEPGAARLGMRCVRGAACDGDWLRAGWCGAAGVPSCSAGH